jgi:hypothetical protein
MQVEFQPGSDVALEVCRGMVVGTNPECGKTKCVFNDGSSIFVSNYLASMIRVGDELRFSLAREPAVANTEIYVHSSGSGPRRRDIYLAGIRYAHQPRKDKRDNLFVSAEVVSPRLGTTRIHLRCETLRDYFYVGDRHRPWGRQPSFYELLRIDPSVSAAELHLAFKLCTLELRSTKASATSLAALERSFNILARPDLRECYDSLLADPAAPAVFPYGGFGSLVVAGELSPDQTSFYVFRILSFLPKQSIAHLQAPLRKFVFYSDQAVFRDSRRKLEILFDQASLPLLWDSTWNQWKHLMNAKATVTATFIKTGDCRLSAPASRLAILETALPSRIEVVLPTNIAEQINQARETYHRFGKFAEALDEIRLRVEKTPIERAELLRLCAGLRIPSDFDAALINWQPDYDAFYYNQLLRRARNLFLFRSEYIFDLEKAVVIETPRVGHATYLFSKPASMSNFLALYTLVDKDDIRHNRANTAERLGFSCRLIHGSKPRAWLRELKARLGEPIDDREM